MQTFKNTGSYTNIYGEIFEITQKFTEKWYFNDCKVQKVKAKFSVEISRRMYKIVEE